MRHRSIDAAPPVQPDKHFILIPRPDRYVYSNLNPARAQYLNCMPRGQNLYFRIYTAVRRIPRGRVATYGQIAALVGSPRGAQVVGWALRVLKPTTNVPWHRVINAAGMISIENMSTPKQEQARKLLAEGIDVRERDGNLWVDMAVYGWKPTAVETKHPRSDEPRVSHP